MQYLTFTPVSSRALCQSACPGFYCWHISLQVSQWKRPLFIRKPPKSCSITSAGWDVLACWCDGRSWKRGCRLCALLARRPSLLTTVYFCWAPMFIFTRVLMSILICLLCYFRWVIGECVGICENSLCLCVAARWRGAVFVCACAHVHARMHTHIHTLMW